MDGTTCLIGIVHCYTGLVSLMKERWRWQVRETPNRETINLPFSPPSKRESVKTRKEERLSINMCLKGML